MTEKKSYDNVAKSGWWTPAQPQQQPQSLNNNNVYYVICPCFYLYFRDKKFKDRHIAMKISRILFTSVLKHFTTFYRKKSSSMTI